MQAVIPETRLPESLLRCSLILLNPALHRLGQPSPDPELAVERAQGPLSGPLVQPESSGPLCGGEGCAKRWRECLLGFSMLIFLLLPPQGRECPGILSEAVTLCWHLV